jgi:hypothetical protein
MTYKTLKKIESKYIASENKTSANRKKELKLITSNRKI